MKRIIVLGTGMVGSVIAADLSNKFSVAAADIDTSAFKKLEDLYGVTCIQSDLLKENLTKLLDPYDIVVNAVPGFMGFGTLKKIIAAGKDVADISFFGEDPFELNAFAKEKNVTAVPDCGVAPGLSNIILGCHHAKEKIHKYECYVGGLPFERVYPFQYKAPFSPSDVIEEYTRPARIMQNGKIIVKEALSEPELLEFDKVGALEAFNSDGLRSLLHTMDIPDMIEKTMRYPGHIDAVKVLRDSGFFSAEKINFNGAEISPLEFTSKMLFDVWKLEDDEDEFTVMRIILKTADRQTTYDLFDRKDFASGFSSMARTTGFTCSAVANLLAEGKIRRKGICPPELIGMDNNNCEQVLDYLKERNVNLTKRIEKIQSLS